MLELPYPPNPEFGDGCVKRLVRLVVEHRSVDAELSDTFHQMRVRLVHDGERILEIESTMERFPTTGCPGATAVLRLLEDTRIPMAAADLYRRFASPRHCTHLLDLAILAIAHAGRPCGLTQFEATVPDERDMATWLTIERNRVLVHRWQVRDGVILQPEPLGGRPLLKGFAKWASTMFAPEEFEAALVLERAWFIARGRRYSHDAVVGASITMNTALAESCFAYDKASWARHRLRSGYVVDAPVLSNDGGKP